MIIKQKEWFKLNLDSWAKYFIRSMEWCMPLMPT